jgi:glycosyltransferase involved in cell wall biosynthesis
VVGPNLDGSSVGYGGGCGGVLTAVRRLVVFLERSGKKYNYCSYSVRNFNKLWFVNLPFRFICDLFKLSFCLVRFKKNTIIHYIADGGFAVYRTLAVCFIAKLIGLPVVIDARGSSLNKFSEGNEGLLSGISWALILNFSKIFLVQQRHTYKSLYGMYENKVIHHPNCIKKRPKSRTCEILNGNNIKVGFVGYCYRKKGVFDLVEGCNAASGKGANIELTLIGEEEHSFSTYLDDFKGHPNLTLRRLGRKSFDCVQQEMVKFDIFVFPSFHPGEGHPNIINEAMSAELAIITTKVGAIAEFLNDERCYFISPHSADDIAEQILNILSDPNTAKKKAKKAFQYSKLHFSESVVYGDLLNVYDNLVKS